MYYFAIIMNVRVSNEIHAELVKHLPPKIKIGPWVDEAIKEKIEREKTQENVILERQNKKDDI